ncbi:MAG: site-specific integrase [Muribaculaceae bacterium]|nr:site-specific integrase [Muribaculaceae bacterium]
MSSIKVKFRPAAEPECPGYVYYQIIHERKIRRIPSSYTLLPHEWSDARGDVIPEEGSDRTQLLLSIRQHIDCDIALLMRIDSGLYKSGSRYSADDLISEFRREVCGLHLFRFMTAEAERLRRLGRVRTSEAYRSTVSSFGKFRNGEDIRLDVLDPHVICRYEAWLAGRNVVPNTVSFYMRILRAVYNRAVKKYGFIDRDPFSSVYTGIDRTVKRALPLQTVRKIRHLDLLRRPSLDYARDMFILSFCMRGMSLVDMAFLRKSDLRGGYVTYRRRKTGKVMKIAWTLEMQTIIEKYGENTSRYLLPILTSHDVDARLCYRNAGHRINRALRKIGMLVGAGMPLTLYVARHSWASVARANGIPVSVISEGLGHESESTTRIYLANLDSAVVDRANALVINSVCS